MLRGGGRSEVAAAVAASVAAAALRTPLKIGAVRPSLENFRTFLELGAAAISDVLLCFSDVFECLGSEMY